MVLLFSVVLVGSAAPAAPRITQIAVGNAHSCALTSGGGVLCWGSNNYAALGRPWQRRGELSHSATPIGIAGLSTGVRSIAVGNSHACVVTSAGRAKCFGAPVGQVGGSPTGSPTPYDVAGLPGGIRSVGTLSGSACALTSGGGIKCWGSWAGNNALPGFSAAARPVDVPGLTSGVSAIAVGVSFICALTNGGGVKCLGFNGSGLGDGVGHPTAKPVDVVGLTSGVRAISAGSAHVCAITAAGGVSCWGSNFSGALGNGSESTSDVPVAVVGLIGGVRGIAAGLNHSCALTGDGGVKCWGANHLGQLGNGTKIKSSTPVEVAGLARGVSAISAGGNSTCALMTTGTVKCWGDGTFGRLGNGSLTGSSTRPVDVRFAAVALAPKATPATAQLRTLVDGVQRILVQSAAGRRELALALTAGFDCSISRREAGNRVNRVVANRQSLLRQLARLRAPTADAARALNLLRAALQHSVEADLRYRDGFYALAASSCPLPPSRNFTLARQSDGRASAAKRAFVTVYNPLAKRVGRRTWSASEF
jgi:hypothetical protein